MAKRVTAIYGGKPIVTEFDFSQAIYSDNDLSIKVFDMPSKEWLFSC